MLTQGGLGMRPGDIRVDDEQPLFTLGGHRLRRAAQHVTWELMDLLPQRREETFRYDGLRVQSPRAVESTAGPALHLALFRLPPPPAPPLFPPPAPPLAPLPF